MKRNYILKGKKLFKEVYVKGKKFREEGIGLFILTEKKSVAVDSEKIKFRDDAGIKIGIHVIKKSGKAHVRNKIKRRIRAICGELLSEMKSGNYMIIKLYRNPLGEDYHRTKKTLRSLLMSAGIYKNAND